MEINYQRELLRIYDTDAFEKKFRELPTHRTWFTIPIELQVSKLYTNVDYRHGKCDDRATLRLLLDTGACNSYSLYESLDERIKIPSSTINTIIGTGLSGKVIVEMGGW